ncbi:calcineurin-like phosphoesterase, partial [Cylindrospermopsis raciborskii CS-506_D]|nr:calcineurin-like phosphoesterase [Cylindrospermopsis raciborskii CS-506_D]MBA4464407.1 calcineurin-like phosphoesterase [Cylindrospermopsis raciborskii CS-506_A]
ISGGVGNDIFYLGVNGRAIGGEGDDRFFVGEGGGNIISGGAGADQFWILTDDPTKLKASNTIVDYTIGTDVIGITNQVANSKGDLTFSGSDISLNGVLIATLNGVNAAGATFVFANPLAS